MMIAKASRFSDQLILGIASNKNLNNDIKGKGFRK